MTVNYDLHCHSTASDGTLAPAEVVRLAASAGVDVLALTDHDTLDGIAEAQQTALNESLQLVAGVEISVSWKKATIHLLGLGVATDSQSLVNGLQTQLAFRSWRGQEMARRLEKDGFLDALQGAQSHCKGSILSRTHFAHYIVDSGRVNSIRDVFKKFLVPGKPGYVSGQWVSLEEAVSWILEAGGIPVIAHPARYKFTRTRLRTLLDEFKMHGGIGLEVVSGSHSLDETRHMAVVARDHNLLASRGSDYHGPEKPWVQMGRLRPLPVNCPAVWEHEHWRGGAS